MSFLDWLKSLSPKREAAPEAHISRELANRISEKAHALQEELMIYYNADNPFAAMMADLYNKDQIKRVWKNGSGA